MLNALQSSLFGDKFSTWVGSEQHGGNMLFNGLLRLHYGKLSGPRESGSPGLWMKYPVALNVPTGCCNSGEDHAAELTRQD